MNHEAVDRGINSLHKVEIPAAWADAVDEEKEVKEPRIHRKDLSSYEQTGRRRPTSKRI